MNENYDVVVVGGGVAGLTAASELTEAGCSVAVLEARPRLGGRLFSGDFAPGEATVEFGGAYLALDQQPVLRDLIERTGTAVTKRISAAKSSMVVNGTPRQLSELDPEVLLQLERIAFRIMAAADRFSLDKPVWEQDISDLDVPLADFLEQETGRTEATDLVAGFFTQLAGTEADTVSALWPLGLVAWRGKSLLAMLSSRIFEFETGSADFIARLAAGAGDVVLDTAVASITETAAGVRVTSACGRNWGAERVIVAAPVNTLAQIDFSPGLPAEMREYLSLGHPGAGAKILMRVSGMRGPVNVTGLSGGFRHLTTVRDEGETLLLAGFGLRSELDTDDPRALESALQEMLPGARLEHHSAHDWGADPWSRGTWMVFRPGEALRVPALFNAGHGRVSFAGSDVADQWAGNIEGAARSGRRAATRVIDTRASEHERGART